jgi:Uma2 family endonuclease
VKGPLYAENGVLDYWIVNLKDDRIEVHRRPEGSVYGETFAAGRGESLSPAAFPDFEVRADDVLP